MIAIIIPSYEPDDRLYGLLDNLKAQAFSPVILVDDGGGEAYKTYFDKAEHEYGFTVLTHEVNKGKGRALKTAFKYCIDTFGDELTGCITIDSDGQHTIESMNRVVDAVTPDSQLILGVRDFESAGVPKKSQFGNNLTKKVFKNIYKTEISDTQTGLRYISRDYMELLLDVEGERFEFETKMLIDAISRGFEIEEVTIETIYDSAENHQTHFDPIKDSIRIYRLFGFKLLSFAISSLSSSLIDLALFQILCIIFRNVDMPLGIGYVVACTAMARVVSAIYNYLMNYYYVFGSNQSHGKSAVKYLILAVCQMLCSALFVSGLVSVTGASVELFVKIPVDVVLFFLSYNIQKKLIY